jgi:hypothetical protein
MSMDYILINLIVTNLNKISSGYLIVDFALSMCLIFSTTYIYNENMKKVISNYIQNLFFQRDKESKLTFKSSDKDVSSKYKALMYFINNNNDPSVKSLMETEIKKYNYRKEAEEIEASVYRVIQNNKFLIDKNIYGRVFTTEKDKTESVGKTVWIEYQNLEISSPVLNIKKLIEWVDNVEKEYKNYIKIKMLESQSLVEINWDNGEEEINCFYTPWESNVTFNNRFFTGKKDLVKKIKFFLENEQWYKDRGIPYTLGILLWGEPGCGKTGFIKALMNLTGRHGIDIKLSNNFNFTRLREIICDEQITPEIIIPQNKRILLFEDIDAMGDIVKDRDLASDKPKSKELDLENTIKEYMSKKNKKEKPANDENNNLSYFLNILDGLNECPGRIIIMTTNKPEHLDNALIRPGRIDFKIHMTKATTDDIKQILEHYWTTEFDNEVPLSWEQKLSHAEIVSFCRMSDNIEDTYFKIDKFVDKGSSSPRFYLNTPVASPPVELNLYDSETQ